MWTFRILSIKKQSALSELMEGIGKQVTGCRRRPNGSMRPVEAMLLKGTFTQEAIM